MLFPQANRLLTATTILAGVGSLAFVAAYSAPETRLAERLAAFYDRTRPEVSYLHLNQPAYVAGETLWFKAYVVDAQAHQADTLSKVLYVDVVSPEQQVVFRRTLALQGGFSEGDIVLPDTLSQGIYTIRAYTNWMRNAGQQLFFARPVPVWQGARAATAPEPGSSQRTAARARRAANVIVAASRPDVQFFPEGGDYVAGLPTVVGIKAVDAAGRGLAVRGTILDDKNQEVAQFATPILGMTSLNFTPIAGRRYQARVVLPDDQTAQYPLPAVQATGWVLNVREFESSYRVYVRHQGTAAAPEPLRVMGHVRGVPVYLGEGQLTGSETFTATIPKAKLPAGLLHITLFDGQSVARAERLVSVAETQPLQITLRPDKASYKAHEPVSMAVEVRTAAGEPAPAELSFTVTDLTGLPTTAASDATVQSHLLLTADLRGPVENPGSYFRSPTPATRKALDDLLLTQGWSRFVWKEVLAEASPTANYLFPLERTLTLGGQLVRPNGDPVPNGQLTMFQKKDRSLLLSTTNEEGYFLFTGFEGRDTAQVLLQARTEKGKRNVLLRLHELWPLPDPARPVSPLLAAPAEAGRLADYGQRSRRQQVLERQYRPDTTSGILLGNVNVQGRKAPVADPRSLHGSSASHTILMRDVPNADAYQNVLDMLQSRVPGVRVSKQGFLYSISLRGYGSPIFILDGIRLLDLDPLLALPPSQVERVDVLQAGQAAIYGLGASGGAIAVFTKRGNPSYKPSSEPAAGVAVRRLPAFYRTREFYAPHYASAAPAKPDPRTTTLYWQPRVSVPASGQARVTFYTADQAGTFRATVEGISAAGQPALAETTLTVVSRP